MKPTQEQIAEYFGLCGQTLSNWKKTEKGLLRFEALKAYYIAHQEKGNR